MSREDLTSRRDRYLTRMGWRGGEGRWARRGREGEGKGETAPPCAAVSPSAGKRLFVDSCLAAGANTTLIDGVT